MDEDEVSAVETVGQRLRAAREAQGLTVEEIAATTRIPTRHLESLEASDWAALPAPTYSMGFAKNYAAAVGLDKAEIAEQLRGEMGGVRPAQQPPPELFEPADPKRTMPKGLVLGALAGLILVALLLTWLSNRDLADNSPQPADNVAAPAAAAPIAPPPVVITASEAAWVDIRDGQTILKQGELAAGQSFEVPATAIAPTLSTAKPEALRISIGTADAPPIGTAGNKVDNVSLKSADLMKGPPPAAAAPAVTAPAPAPAATRPTPRPVARRTKPAPAKTPAAATPPATTTPPAGNTTG
ncbi:MAG: RodZ domain-containing protein [Sphingomicrobium sp.]